MFDVIKSLFYNYKENNFDDLVDVDIELLKLLEYHRIDMILADKLSLPKYRNINSNLINKKNIVYRNNENYINAVKEINEAFNDISISYVLLKGCALIMKYYQKTYHRSFNDIDFLIDVKDIGKVEKILNELGYIQGEVVDGHIVKAHRKDIIFQRINTHEIYHMVKFNERNFEVNVDINFKFAWVEFGSSGDSLISFNDVSKNVDIFHFNNMPIPLLNSEYQFLHLCCHLYNEAVFFALDKQYVSGDDPKELSLFRLFDIFLVSQYEMDIEKIYMISKNANCIHKIEYVLSLFHIILGECFVVKFAKHFNVNNDFPNYYYSVNGDKIEWPINLFHRLFDIDSKYKALKTLVEEGHL
ncbi:MAG: nucleotidyltransferase family protein [Candidatus Cloacimonetes bacterium]|jgi:hypothetical protein|nr:nucleotidyltransferase family protein [Clostridia bacterium]MDD2683304.1 nucleotidyltransferase family protein [Candidatus Cloacimonadota bacterium]MDD3092666.1 nucleotidyltransferase family protein [Clostridia bacterium]MDD3971473.1 nucleotidyltransferase family protein [Clostridia bacterium]